MKDNSGDLHSERKDYDRGELHRDDLPDNPLNLFGQWMTDARDASIIDATAMTLATVGANGAPSARIVLLKQFTEEGFYWYTNYERRKGSELHTNPNAALVFYWRELERQVRIEGSVGKASAGQSDEYFNKRPLESRFSAVASPQSQVIENQRWLTERTNGFREKFSDSTLPRPDTWGGYVLKPAVFEFWQGRPSRQHDRFRFSQSKAQASAWNIDRLAP